MRILESLLAAVLLASCATDSLVEGGVVSDPEVSEPTPDPEEPTWSASFQGGTVVGIETGEISGVMDNGLRVFKGIPYAAAPTGDLRLRDPQPASPWAGTMDASEFGPACPQRTVAVLDALSQVDQTDEDCLTVNVWAHDDATPRPVMVWIHGGAFFYGAGSQDMYDGSAIAKDGVVVVSLNYRLGALGFLAHRELGADVGNDNPGNFGLKDQALALQWVRDNIAVFGGDPENVTVFGESAGGISTCILASTPAAAGLMDKAILQSAVGCHHLPTGTEPGAIGGNVPLDYGDDLVDALGCGSASDKLACLQAVPVGDFLDLIDATGLLTDIDTPFPMPYVDGAFVPEQPAAVYARGDSDIPMIVGTTEDEATLFLSTQAPLTWFGVDDGFQEFLGDPQLTEDALDVYPIWQFPLPQDAYLTFATDVMFSCPSRALAEAGSGGAPVFLYEFRDIQLATALLGSHHALEVPYVFDTFGAMGILPTPSDRQLGDAMRHAWTSFATNGSPAADLGWAPYTAGGSFMAFDDDWGSLGESAYRDGRCDDLAALGLGGLPL